MWFGQNYASLSGEFDGSANRRKGDLKVTKLDFCFPVVNLSCYPSTTSEHHVVIEEQCKLVNSRGFCTMTFLYVTNFT